MKKTLKALSALLTMLMMLGALAACGGGGASTGTGGSTPQAGSKSETGDGEASEIIGTVTLMVDKDTPFDGSQAVIDEIEKKLGIKTEIEIRPGGTEGDNIIKTRLATGDMTDLFMYNSGSLLQAINPEKNILDITDEAFAANLVDDFKNAVTVDGRVYGMPTSSSQAGAWIYNKRIYEELGLEVPKTWDELISNCDAIKEAGYTAIIGSYKDTWTSQLIFLADHYNIKSNMPEFAEKYTANEAHYADTPIALRSWEKLSDCTEYLNTDYLATTYDVAIDMLATGEGAHFPMLSTALSAIYALYPEAIDEIGVFGQPGDDADDHGLTVWMPGAYYIYKDSPNADLAKQWLEFFCSQEGYDIYSSVLMPDGPYVIKGIDLPENAYAGVKQMQADYFDTGKTAVALEFESPVKGPNCEQICVEVGSGMKDPLTAAQDYDKDVQKQAVQLGLEGW